MYMPSAALSGAGLSTVITLHGSAMALLGTGSNPAAKTTAAQRSTSIQSILGVLPGASSHSVMETC